jgi:hypothetical protein
MKFIDGFGDSRIFCKTCQQSMLVNDAISVQEKIPVFREFRKPVVLKRWKNEGIRTIGSFIDRR